MAPSAASLATAALCCAVALLAAAAPTAGNAGSAAQQHAPTTTPEAAGSGTPKAPDAEEMGRRARAASEEALKALSTHGTWLRRMVCAMRLERPDANGARERLIAFAFDPDPRVRSAAVLALARTGAPPLEKLASTEEDPRVVRTMLRCGWQVPADRVERGARTLAKSADNSERLLGVELVGALEAQGRSEKRLTDFAKDTLASVIARLDNEDGGALSPRIAALTGARDSRQDWRWRSWLDRNRASMRIDGGMLTGPRTDGELNPVATLDDASFVKFTGALDELFRKPIDLGVAIDCTASMSAQIAAAQAGIDDLMRFVNAVAGGMRVAIVGFRDQQDDFKTLGWDFTADPAEARAHLWKLSAEGGGDEPEMVFEAMKLAYGKFSWRSEAQDVMVLIGDAPPHPGFGGKTVEMSKAAQARGITTYVLSARGITKTEEVKHFPEIARMGGGRVIRLSARNDLVAELAGVALSDTWHDQIVAVFERYLLLCR
jgi:hypothetical protein